jgi:hypothetical protein
VTAPRRTRLLTSGRPVPGAGRVLTHAAVWCPAGEWVVFDTRPDPAGGVFDGDRIQRVHAPTGVVETLYVARNYARCGIATCHPNSDAVLFTLGPEYPDAAWDYGPARRRGVVVSPTRPGVAVGLDARDLLPPFTPGALRGGTHVHVVHPDGLLVSMSYDDHLLEKLPVGTGDAPRRNVAVGEWGKPVHAPAAHSRNRDGQAFSVVVTRTVTNPRPGSDDIGRACEEAWVGNSRTLAFQGDIVTRTGDTIREAFAVDLPDDLTQPGDGPLEGTATRMPAPPRDTVQRRLTDTTNHRHPGLAGPRHWLRADQHGRHIGLLKLDDDGVAQFWTVRPDGTDLRQVTTGPDPVASAFTWHPDGERVAFVRGGSVWLVDVTTRQATRLTDPAPNLRPEACVVSPTGSLVAFAQTIDGVNQIAVTATG